MGSSTLFSHLDYLHQQPLLRPLAEQLQRDLPTRFTPQHFGDLPRWLHCLQQLPAIDPSRIELDSDTLRIGSPSDMAPDTRAILEQSLRGLHPWRKGPFDFFGVHIDTEWRSDWKWQRVMPHIRPLSGKKVLDVGCGSGYHCWRMRGAGADTVIGIDPGPLFVLQFHAAQYYLQDPQVQVYPLRMEEMPPALQAFDTVFSMGLLYHRREPLEHLQELKDCLQPGGELVLETLVIEGGPDDLLQPDGRYSRMGNVWYIPSPLLMEQWLRQCGFVDVRCVDVTLTTTDEQRSTEWMQFQSLKDFLDPTDSRLTIEGYPAPRRGIFIASKPQ